jgi:hypothetical protein
MHNLCEVTGVFTGINPTILCGIQLNSKFEIQSKSVIFRSLLRISPPFSCMRFGHVHHSYLLRSNIRYPLASILKINKTEFNLFGFRMIGSKANSRCVPERPNPSRFSYKNPYWHIPRRSLKSMMIKHPFLTNNTKYIRQVSHLPLFNAENLFSYK